MLNTEMNDRLTGVGPCTPCGELMRRYWIPFCPSARLDEDPVHKIRLLSAARDFTSRHSAVILPLAAGRLWRSGSLLTGRTDPLSRQPAQERYRGDGTHGGKAHEKLPR